MTHFYVNPMWLYTQRPFEQRIQMGEKKIIITQPTDEIKSIIQSAFTSDLTGNPSQIQQELGEIHSRLQKKLPYMGLPNWKAYLELSETEKGNKKYHHFYRSKNARTLCEMTSLWDMECIEQILAIKQTQLPDWDIYRIRGSKTHSLRRHIVLAYPLNQTHMMVLDPTEGPAREFREGDAYIVDNKRFKNTFMKTPYKTNNIL